MSYPQIISRADAAKILSLSESSLDRLAASGKLQSIQLTPNRIGYLQSELNRFIADGTRTVKGGAL